MSATKTPTHLDLFSGIGGFALAARWAGFRTVGFCEINSYCQKVLAKNFNGYSHDKGEPNVSFDAKVAELPRIYGNIFNFDGKQFAGVSLITGGFPCQPFSVAGKRGGAKDDRHLWPEMLRVISEARPAWVLGENVTGIISMELDRVLSDLEAIGYATRPFVIPACGVDVKHRRNRVWIVAHTDSNAAGKRHNGNSKRGNDSQIQGGRNCKGSENESTNANKCSEKALADTNSPSGTGNGNCPIRSSEKRTVNSEHCRWGAEPAIRRVVNGLPNRSHRLKGLGNAIVPQVAYQILKPIADLIRQEEG